jgi:hypothetical protein
LLLTICSSIVGILIVLVCLLLQRRYIDCSCLFVRFINIPTMAEERQGQSIYLRWTKTKKGNQIYLRLTNRQTRAINIHTMDEDRQGQSINLTNRQEQSIYLRCNNRQTRTINIPTMDEQIVKSNQNTYNRIRYI